MTIRQEIHAYVDELPESKLIMLKPLLFTLADESIVIERNLTNEENVIIARGMALYDSNPSDFTPLENIK